MRYLPKMEIGLILSLNMFAKTNGNESEHEAVNKAGDVANEGFSFFLIFHKFQFFCLFKDLWAYISLSYISLL